MGDISNATDQGSTKNGQKQEPDLKGASRSRKRKPRAEPGAVINDPNLYAEMSRPFATADEANAAFRAFLVGVRALRIKHRIADVVTVVSASVEGEGTRINWGQNGDATLASLMLSFALGASEADDRARLDAMRRKGQMVSK